MAAPQSRGNAGRGSELTRRAFTMAVLGMLLAGAHGCGGDKPPPPPPPPTRVEAKIVAAKDLNPDMRGIPAPLFLRVYTLRAETAFANADFFQLHENDTAILGGDLVKRSELVLRPGETQPLTRELEDEVRFLGFVAAYQEIDRATWRALLPVPQNKTTKVTIELGPRDIVIKPVEEPQEKPKKKG
ncbi:MAG TPA: type VI secretion system lipoprotein TssJ [Defluviicoccus sp.]|nr:type VI secretion system lipoprotein TssJ [Defluviicoccus sp.]